MPTILVIDDDRAIFLLVRQALEGVADIVTAETADAGIKLLKEESIDAVLLDIMLPDRSGMAVFCEIQEYDRRLPVIFMTIEATSQTAIEAMQLGAFDYLAKPLQVASLRTLVSRAIEQRELSSVPVAIVADDTPIEKEGELFIGRSSPMLEVFKDIGRVSKQHIPVLVRGESGTGKELVARALYHYSDRSEGPFLAVNCAALPENLLESELFGHEKGAFTGADSRRIGKFEQCNGGTLFLDEIGDMSSMVQAKVLRVLQDQRFERVGGNNELKTDVRIVAATNRPLEKMVDQGDFREDLLYRLNAVTISLPPLRDRSIDIPLLIQYFLGQAKREFNKQDLEGASPETVDLLKQYPWPGNVRQLRAVIRRCVLDSVLPVIVPSVLPTEIHRKTDPPRDGGSDVKTTPSEPQDNQPPGRESGNLDGRNLPELVDRLLSEKSTDLYAEAIAYAEQYLLVRVLRATDGNQSKAAEILGITRGKLRDRIATYNIKLESGVKIGE
ncbi:MAG: sigma-54-dependent Fis family transcriptional regulator [Pirellulaceae bacterium]|nr:sigma-54-dependent Fis family transcriptional regulator [Pirellulaceae bacterium]